MIRQIKIGQKMKLPICGKLIVNHKEKTYAREADYYFDKQLDPYKTNNLTMHTTIIGDRSHTSNGNDKHNAGNRQLIIHPIWAR